MGNEWNGGRHDPSEHDTPTADELERQAREAIAEFRARVGDLGDRVRRVVERAGAHWEATAPVPAPGSGVALGDGERARALARRWADIDFLVDPDLAAGLAVHRLEDASLWRIEVRERGETRMLEERTAPYRGDMPPQEQPILPLWDYSFPLTPEIEAGERHERLPGTGSVLACDACSGTGRRTCRTCEGRGSDVCPRCRGRARLTCPRCRGRGRVSRTRVGMPHLQASAEQSAAGASERVLDFADRLRQDWHLPVPPAHDWLAPTSSTDDTIPCPDCENGTIACECDNGQRPCATCGGTGAQECPACKGSGRVVHHGEVIRRFDTRLGTHTLPLEDRMASWAPRDVLARGVGEPIWTGSVDDVSQATPPTQVPPAVWSQALTYVSSAFAKPSTRSTPSASESERRVIARQVSVVRLPLTRLEYEFAERHYVVVAFGTEGSERFWADSFPHRWSRVGRFLRAISRDLGEAEPPDTSSRPAGQISPLDAYRTRQSPRVEPAADASEGPAAERTGPAADMPTGAPCGPGME